MKILPGPNNRTADGSARWVLMLYLLVAAVPAFPLLLRGEEPRPGSSGDSLEAHIGKGYEHVQNNLFQEAALEFQAALALDPRLVRVRYQLAVCYFALKQFKQSREEFERLHRETVGDAGILYYLGRLDLQDENLEAAISHLRKAAASDSPFPDTPFYLGSAYLKKGEWESAERWLNKAAEVAPRDFRVPDRLGRVYLKMGRRPEAEKQYALSAELRQRNNEGASQALECSREVETRPLEEARATCQKLFDSSDPDKLTLLGMIYGKQGHYAEALEPFAQAARLDPDSFEIQHNFGLSYFRLKRYAEARPPLEKAVALRPDYFGSNALLGATLYALKEDEAAYRVLDHAHQLNPQDTDTAALLSKITVLLAQKSFSKKNYQECLSYLQKAAQLRPEDAQVHRRLAEVYGLLGRRAQAERETRQADRLSGTGP